MPCVLLAMPALVLGMLPACGASAPPDVHARHAAIQREEARLERALAAEASLRDEIARLGASEERCGDLAARAHDASEAAHDLCDVAAPRRDADAAVRCERARRRAHEASEHVSACDPEIAR